jgi:hypothetical protein
VLVLSGGLPIVLWLTPALSLPDGTGMFDTRLTGYSHAHALSYLSALTPEARALYLGPLRIADTVFPIGLFGLLVLIPRLGPFPRLAAIVAVAATAYLALDLFENALIAGLLRVDPPLVDPAAVARASAVTSAKFVAFALSAAFCALTLVMRARLWLNHGS